ncbi:MAG TPA: hypothetical protein VGH43_06465 [Jatrophihabitans sp.]|jgi:hypothetical protein
MAGYAATPQARKLGLKPGLRVRVEGAPDGWRLDDPPDLLVVTDGAVDVLIAFVRAAAELDPARWGADVYPNGALWVAWPRKAAGHVSDVTENAIRDAVLPLGLVDVKVAAIDDDWSGLKMVWRVEKRSSKIAGG